MGEEDQWKNRHLVFEMMKKSGRRRLRARERSGGVSVGETGHLVLDRRAVARAAAGDPPG